jgi:hypothetical protein
MKESQSYWVRVATGDNYVLTVIAITPDEIVSSEAAWIAETGCRLHHFLAGGPTSESECERMGAGFAVARQAIVAWQPWAHAVPVSQ